MSNGRLSELEHETDELRRKLGTQNVNPQSSPIAILTAAAEMGVHREGTNAGDIQLPPPSQPSISSYSQQMMSLACLGPSIPRIESDSESRSDPTSSQTLNGITITGQEIDEIFQLCVSTLLGTQHG